MPRQQHAGDDIVQADDTLALLFLCCHPALPPACQLALTLRAVGGLSTAETAAALLVPEATMAKRITRANSGSPPLAHASSCRPGRSEPNASAWC